MVLGYSIDRMGGVAHVGNDAVESRARITETVLTCCEFTEISSGLGDNVYEYVVSFHGLLWLGGRGRNEGCLGSTSSDEEATMGQIAR